MPAALEGFRRPAAPRAEGPGRARRYDELRLLRLLGARRLALFGLLRGLRGRGLSRRAVGRDLLAVGHESASGPRIVSPALEGWMIVVFEENFPQNAATNAETTAAHSSPDIMESARASWSVAAVAPIP